MSRTTSESRVAGRGTPIGESIKLSNLEYPMVRPMSLVTQRRQIEHQAQSTSYAPSSTITTFINSGDDYINGRGCYLRFDVQWTTQSGVYGPDGSIVNCIDNISLYHSSGTLIDRVEEVGLRHSVMMKQLHTPEWFTNNATNYGYNGTDGVGAANLAKYSIPLSTLHSFWDSDKLIPAMLSSGMKVVIQLKPSAIVTSGTALGTYVINNPIFVMDSLTLTDSAQLHLQEESAKNGLVFPFKSWDHVSQAPGSSTSYNLSVFRAVSQATDAFAVARLTADIADAKDSFLPVTVGADETESFAVQWKLGSQYFPIKALDTLTDIWQFNRMQVEADAKRVAPFPVSTNKYSGVHMVRLERDALIKGQGIPVSGSRSLNYTATFGSAAIRTIDVFMGFISLARVYMFDKVLIQN
jgi:hypothetical protein